MKAGLLYGPLDFRVGDVPDPTIKPNEVLIETSYAGICGTDSSIYRGGFTDRVRYPAVLGHEFGGVILEVGKDVTGYRRGDRVVADPKISCHSCPACRSGHTNACRTLKLLGIDLPGGFGQLVPTPANQLYPYPESIPFQFAPMVELYALGHHVLQRGQIQPGETVAIFGAGKLGLSILDVMMHKADAVTAISIDFQQSRIEIAKKLGAEFTIDLSKEDPVTRVMEITHGLGVDCAVEAVGHYRLQPEQEPPIAQALKMIRNGGRIIVAGMGEQTTPIHFKTLVVKEANIITSRVTEGEFPRAIRLLEKEQLHPELLVTDIVSVCDIAETFARLEQDDPRTLKVVLDMKKT